MIRPVSFILFVCLWQVLPAQNGDTLNGSDEDLGARIERLLDARKYEEAIPYSMALIQQAELEKNDSLRGLGLNELARSYSGLGDRQKALEYYEQSAEVRLNALGADHPDYAESHYNLGLTLISLKKYKEAIQRINKYVELAPSSEHQIANELIKTLNSIAK